MKLNIHLVTYFVLNIRSHTENGTICSSFAVIIPGEIIFSSLISATSILHALPTSHAANRKYYNGAPIWPIDARSTYRHGSICKKTVQASKVLMMVCVRPRQRAIINAKSSPRWEWRHHRLRTAPPPKPSGGGMNTAVEETRPLVMPAIADIDGHEDTSILCRRKNATATKRNEASYVASAS